MLALPCGAPGDRCRWRPWALLLGGTKRMRMRGVELGGVGMAIEVPGWFDWRPEPDAARAPCDASEAEVRLTLHPLYEAPEIQRAVAYPYADGTLEVGRCGAGDWVLAIRAAGAYQRVARLDPTLTFGQLGVSHSVVASGTCPVARPLDCAIVAHRAVACGSLVVWGSAAVRDGRALVFLGDERPVAAGAPLARGWLVLRPGASSGVEVCSLAFAPGSTPISRVPLHAIHVSESMFAGGAVPDTLDEEAAAGELLRYAFAPVGGALIADTMLLTACRLSSRIPVVRTGTGRRRRFAWTHGPTGVSARAASPGH